MTQAPMRLVREDQAPEPMRFGFTVKQLDRLQATDQRRWVYDDRNPGLAMQITPAGHKAFYFAKRIEGRYRKIKLGDYADLSIEQARKLAQKHAGKIADGENPAEAKRQARAATTFGELFTHYIERHAKKHKRTWEDDQRMHDNHLKRWAGRRLDQIKRHDVQALHDRIGKEAPIAANRVLALVSKMFSVAQAIGYIGDNPAKGVQRFAEHSRDRYLDTDELPRFLAAVEAEQDGTFRDYFRVLLFTGQRRENAASMRWEEVDLRRKVWTIPGSKFKTGSAVEVPLVDAVVKILTDRRDRQAEARKKRIKKGWPDQDPRDAYVFPSKRRESVKPHMYEPKIAFSRVCEAAGITGLRLHDLRRTTASWATMQGVPYPVVARMVGHKPQGVTSIYARFDLSAVRDGFDKTVNAMLVAKGGE